MKVLVTAASKHGSTWEIAAAIDQRLRSRGVDAVLLEPSAVTDLAGFDAAILGSGVYAGRWLEAARSFVGHLGTQLASRHVWLFSSGPIGDPPSPADDPVDTIPMMTVTRAHAHKVFAGRLHRKLLSLPERAVVRALRAPEGDFRDWDEIEAWADGIAEFLQNPDRTAYRAAERPLRTDGRPLSRTRTSAQDDDTEGFVDEERTEKLG